ncbi:hypothetical protein TVAG_440910 [Trichomonas vaginalis G3]|uniref:Uncharacterized protein n=1 Tax=Trichomonas vaginalis (strain ATCC PRA-98 / G3) TaxID=412133 RepID=A2EXB3_TRIV3|nr:hypothetical protein TVAGG3_0765590 [Trichomonas vaginalis G3]EAY02712.1 hypothetical protein TVAG_440910 [Trichomonas vaginalis G3]KAI5513500.1 hypothetical protein TVAGG3_0765590 [Trichomonas vaginalis G3]|eukprot:XP_001314935.1 hypothetical protein [Trichomonas vaginalis G3]
MLIKALNLGALRTSQDAFQCLTLICELAPEHFHYLEEFFSPSEIYEMIIHYSANEEETLQYAEYATMLTKYLYYFCLNCKDMSDDNFTSLGILIQHTYRYEQTWQKMYVFKTLYLLLETDKIKISDIGPDYFNISFQDQFKDYGLSNGLELCKLMNLMLEKGWDGKEYPYCEILFFIFSYQAKESTYPIMETLAYALEKMPIEMKACFLDDSLKEYCKIILGCCCAIGNGQLCKTFGSMLRMGQILVNLYQDFPEKLMNFYPHSYQALINLLQIENVPLQKKILKLFIFMTQTIMNMNLKPFPEIVAYFEENDGASVMDFLIEQEDEEIEVLLDQLHNLLYP